jgi:NAD(P)-dependent dehydrogenase (short-subunit alcohol dehydrogenase family)
MAGTADQTSLADWNRIMAVNLTGTFLATKHAVPHLEKTGGRIVNVSSEAGLVGIGGQLAYNVSKTGMIAITKSCAIDYARRGIRVTCVCPGTTWTPLVEGLLDQSGNRPKVLKRLESSRPENRLGTADEVASAILYLASDEAAYATGAILSVDGGYTAQ